MNPGVLIELVDTFPGFVGYEVARIADVLARHPQRTGERRMTFDIGEQKFENAALVFLATALLKALLCAENPHQLGPLHTNL